MLNFFLTEDGVFAESIAESVASAAILSTHRNTTYYLWTLFVKKNYRNRGFATKLLTEICRVVDSENCDLWPNLDAIP